MDKLVSTEWLAGELEAENLIVLEASSHLPNAGRDARADYLAGHIPGARFLDLPSFFDPQGPVPLAIPSAAQVQERLRSLGVREDSRIVLYDDSFIKTSARAWFILRCQGVQNVAILDGGLAKWKAEGRTLESGEHDIPTGDFVATAGHAPLRDKAQILANLGSRQEQIADGRGPGHFTGEDADFDPKIASGHIPGARNVFFASVFNEDGTFKDEAGIRAAFAAEAIDLDRPVITACGGGVVAAVLYFALEHIGKTDVCLYDGSWSEWGADPHTPKATGPAANRSVG